VTVLQLNLAEAHAKIKGASLIFMLPAILFFGPDQQERYAYRVVGYLKVDKFLGVINPVLNKPLS